MTFQANPVWLWRMVSWLAHRVCSFIHLIYPLNKQPLSTHSGPKHGGDWGGQAGVVSALTWNLPSWGESLQMTQVTYTLLKKK